MPATNYLEPALATSVKFYASLSRNQAKGLDSIGTDLLGNPIYVEPGAVCFVSDAQGNSIFVNTRLFGDGANSGGSGGGSGTVEIGLSDIDVVVVNNQVLKTLADYFLADGTFVTDSLKVFSTRTDLEGEEYQVTVVEVNDLGIEVKGSPVITADDLEIFRQTYLSGVGDATQEEIDAAERRAKAYADSLVTSVYKIKGSVNSYSDLANIQNPSVGDVYNVVNKYDPQTGQSIPAGTNYVYVIENSVARWDPLGGTIDMSAYKTWSDTQTAINEALLEGKGYTDQKFGAASDRIGLVETAITGINNTLTTQGNTISGLSVTIQTNQQNIQTNTQNINNIVTQLTWQ